MEAGCHKKRPSSRDAMSTQYCRALPEHLVCAILLVFIFVVFDSSLPYRSKSRHEWRKPHRNVESVQRHCLVSLALFLWPLDITAGTVVKQFVESVGPFLGVFPILEHSILCACARSNCCVRFQLCYCWMFNYLACDIIV